MKPWMAVVALTWVIKGYGCNKNGHGNTYVIEPCHYRNTMHYILKFRFIVPSLLVKTNLGVNRFIVIG